MPPIDPNRWRVLRPYLDELLDLPDAEQDGWLARVSQDDPSLGADLQVLRREHEALARERFLESPVLQGVALAGPAVEAGQRVGAYTLVAPIDEGGMGSVWLAARSDGQFERQAAVKFLQAGRLGPEGQARFRREGRILARLTHPAIAQLLDAGVRADGQPYLVLEYVQGDPIDVHCEARRAGIHDRLRLFLDVLAAVAHAHANLIVHRDLKPSNVLVTPEGRVKLLDFGIASLVTEEGGTAVTRLTMDHRSPMTLAYAAPEQVNGGQVSTATDVYALGVLLHVLLAGRHPAELYLRSHAELVKAIAEIEPRRVSETAAAACAGDATVAATRGTTPERLVRALRGDLDTIVARALKKAPAERYETVTALAEDVRRFLRQEPIAARPDSVAYRLTRFVRRNRVPVSLGALALTALVAGVTGTVIQARRAAGQAARADAAARAAIEQRDFAMAQLSRAEAINDLNAFVLSEGARLEEPVTVAELLQRAEAAVGAQTGVPLENRIELLLSIAYQYQSLDQYSRAEALLTTAYELSSQSQEAATRAKAACALASVLGLSGNAVRAEQLMAQAYGQLPDAPQFLLHHVFCDEMGSFVAGAAGDAPLAVTRAERARTRFAESRLESPLMALRLDFALAVAQASAGRWHEAVQVYDEAYRTIAALGRTRTRTGGAVLNNRANALLALGQPKVAEPLFRQLLEETSASEGGATPVRLLNMARALRDLERNDEAQHYIELAYAAAVKAGNPGTTDQALIVAASIYRQQGRAARAAQSLAQLEPRLARLPAGHIFRGVVASERALVAWALGDRATALAEADRALALAEASSQRDVYLTQFLRRRADLRRQAGHLADARIDAERAVQLERSRASEGVPSGNLGLAWLALGHVLEAAGEARAATDAFRAAAGQLRPAFGDEHPATRAAVARVTPPPPAS